MPGGAGHRITPRGRAREAPAGLHPAGAALRRTAARRDDRGADHATTRHRLDDLQVVLVDLRTRAVLIQFPLGAKLVRVAVDRVDQLLNQPFQILSNHCPSKRISFRPTWAHRFRAVPSSITSPRLPAFDAS